MYSMAVLYKMVEYLWHVLKCSISKIHATYIEDDVCKTTKRLDGKTVIVTGANTGIGKETVLDLARRGARVIMACRNLKKADKALKEITEKTGNKSIVVKHLDLSSLKSVRTFAEDIKTNESRLDILINNAGVFNLPKLTRTEDGFETTMAANHLSHFLLTNLLLDLLKKSAPSRIVIVASRRHREWSNGPTAGFDFQNMNGEVFFDGIAAYGQSKLANILFTRELAKRLEGTGVTANSLHPGVIATDILRHFTAWQKLVLSAKLKYNGKTIKEGAQTKIYLAVSEEVEGVTGLYFADCKEEEPSKYAQDDVTAKKLWEISAKLVNMGTSM